MNNGYVKKFFFVLILFGCLNNKVLTTEYIADNAASYEPTQPKAIRIKITLSQAIPHLKDISETSSSGTIRPKRLRPKRLRSNRARLKTTPFEGVSSEVTPFEAGPSKATPFEMVLPQVDSTNSPSPYITYIPVSYKLDRIYKKNKHLLCNNPTEIKKATASMDQAVDLLKYYATTNNGFKYYSTTTISGVNLYYRNNGNGSSIEKCQFQIYNPDKYDDIINTLWDPNGPRKFDRSLINGKAVRLYNRNLLMMLRLYKNDMLLSERYFYALAKKVHISEDTTIIVMASGNVNDSNPYTSKLYVNKIVNNINSFKTSVDNDNDIMTGNYKRSFVNLSGFLIKKKNDHVDVTFVNSMDFNIMIPIKMFIRDANMQALMNVIAMKHYFNRK
ncbi:fam-a protein [Plasmodium vinckei vinckei]|uniref:Fam-a protein n=1 Tax=Plasmodium vinckei vinckei TaxID=54757 RepID=A0A449BQH6_PLAVN|nr:fam-a protein [Plasmodium vinckei vinckei]VEV55619.1 fam-a protein [Plasmodium vinckei vinckei]